MSYNRRRNRYHEKKKPYATESIVALVAGGIALVLFFVFMLVAAATAGNVGKIVSAISVISLILAVVALFNGLSMRTNENFDKITRLAGIIVSAIAVTLWMLLYIVGIVVA